MPSYLTIRSLGSNGCIILLSLLPTVRYLEPDLLVLISYISRGPNASNVNGFLDLSFSPNFELWSNWWNFCDLDSESGTFVGIANSPLNILTLSCLNRVIRCAEDLFTVRETILAEWIRRDSLIASRRDWCCSWLDRFIYWDVYRVWRMSHGYIHICEGRISQLIRGEQEDNIPCFVWKDGGEGGVKPR